MIEVVTYTREMRRIDSADCELDAAVFTARTLLHEAIDSGCAGALAGFYVDGKLVRLARLLDLSASA